MIDPNFESRRDPLPEPPPARPRLTLVEPRPARRLLFPGWGPELWRNPQDS